MKKAKILVKVIGIESTGDFIFEHLNDRNATDAFKRALPSLHSKGSFVASALNFPLTLDGVPVQQSPTDPEAPPQPDAKRIEFWFMSVPEALAICESAGIKTGHVMASGNSVVVYTSNGLSSF